jgi:hypothetical protein
MEPGDVLELLRTPSKCVKSRIRRASKRDSDKMAEYRDALQPLVQASGSSGKGDAGRSSTKILRDLVSLAA